MAFELEFMENFKGNFTVTKGKDTLILDNQKMKIYLKTPWMGFWFQKQSKTTKLGIKKKFLSAF